MTQEELGELLAEQPVANVVGALDAAGFVVAKKKTTPTVPAGSLVNGYVCITRADGVPIPGIRITIYHKNSTSTVLDSDGVTVIHPYITNVPTVYVTDAGGKVSIPLIKGAVVRVNIEASVTREITVPQADFNLLSDDVVSEPDMFTSPVIPNVPGVVRDN